MREISVDVARLPRFLAFYEKDSEDSVDCFLVVIGRHVPPVAGSVLETQSVHPQASVFPVGTLVPLIVTYSDSEEVSAKGEIIHSCCCARACGNVKNLSLLTGYTVGGRRPAVMNMFLQHSNVYWQIFSRGMHFVATNTQILSGVAP